MQAKKPQNNSRTSSRWDELFAQSDSRLLEAMEEFERAKTIGDNLADHVTNAAGSWCFVLGFIFFMIVWVLLNVVYLIHPFDPAPFVLLNLALSTIAALQAPVILMSQRRQSDRERLRAQHEYLMNLETNRHLQDMHEEITELRDDMRNLMREFAKSKARSEE